MAPQGSEDSASLSLRTHWFWILQVSTVPMITMVSPSPSLVRVLAQIAGISDLRLAHFSERSWAAFHDVFACVRDSAWQPAPTVPGG